MAKRLRRRNVGDRSGAAKATMSRWLWANREGSYPYFFGRQKAWVNNLVNRRKQNGRLRLCLVPKDVNAAIQREHHVTPTLEEILPKLNGATVFSIVDAKCGYWNVVLDKGSNYLTTFNSPFGRYRFNGLPSGLKNVTRHLSNQNWPNIWTMRRSDRNCRRHRSFSGKPVRNKTATWIPTRCHWNKCQLQPVAKYCRPS